MKKTFLLILSMALFVSVYSLPTPVSGTISADETWNLAGSPYIVTGNITVGGGVTLTIEAGVQVKFDNGRSMFSHGTINATSTTFTSNDGAPIPGIWNLFEFYTGASGTLSGCTIEYANYLDINPGASVTINSSVIQNMYYYGIYNGGTLNLNFSTIDLVGYVTYGHGLYTHSSSVSNLNNVNIFNCNYGVYITTTSSQVNFTDCTLSSNIWPVYFNASGDITIAGTNDFTGNTRDAFYIHHTGMSKNWTLPYINVPYFFRTNFDVNTTYTLTIASQNIIKFAINTGMEIYGKLVANALVGESIYFTSDRDDNWGG